MALGRQAKRRLFTSGSGFDSKRMSGPSAGKTRKNLFFGDVGADDDADFLAMTSEFTSSNEEAEKQALLAEMVAELRKEVTRMEEDEWMFAKDSTR